MELSIEKVLERDVDLYIINKLINDSCFKGLFLNKVGLKNYSVIKCIHSYIDENGESDITIILENETEKIGLLLENKINAVAMKNQYNRYKLRAKKQRKNGLFDKYYIFIISPKDYIKNNTEAKKYDNSVTYEELLEYVKDDLYGSVLLNKAIQENKKGYDVIENKKVTAFWKKYYDYIEKEYKNLDINRNDSIRGSNAHWATFSTSYKDVTIIHKANVGFVDLTFKGLAEYIFDVEELVKDTLEKHNLKIKVTGKSLAIRKKVSKVDFRNSFEKQKDSIKESLEAALELQSILKEIDCRKILNLKK